MKHYFQQTLLAAFLLVGCLPMQAKKVLSFAGLVESSEVVTLSNGKVAAPEVLSSLLNGYTVNYPGKMTVDAEGWKLSTVNKSFEIEGFNAGDVVTITLSANRLTTNGTVTTDLDTYKFVAQAGKESVPVTLTGTKIGLYTKDGQVCIASMEIQSAEEVKEHYEMPEPRVETPQNRALWACQTADGKNTFVSWRARKTDDAATSYVLYKNGKVYDVFTDKTNVTIEGTADTYATDTYRLEVKQGYAVDDTQTMELKAGSVKPHSWMRIALAEEPVPANTGVMWDKDGKDTGYKVRYTPNDMSCCDMDGDGQEEIIVKWDPSNSQDNGYSGYTANVYIDCYKVDWQKAEPAASLMWRIDLGQNIRAGAHYTQFLCYDFDGDGKGEMIVKTSLGTKDGLGNFVFQSRIAERGLDVTRDYTRQDDNGAKQKSNGHIGVGEEWLTVFEGSTGRELATVDFYPKFSVVSDWNEPKGSRNKYNKGTRFKACVAFLDGKNPSAVYNRGYYSQSFFTAYNWNGEHLYEVWRHASTTPGEGLYGQGNHSLVVADVDGDGCDEIGTGPAVLDHDGTVLWTSGLGHGDALHLGDFDPDNDGLEIFYVNEEFGESDWSTALFDAKTGKIMQGHKQFGMDTGRGLAADLSARHAGAELLSKGDNDSMGNSYLVQYVDGSPDWLGGSGDYGWCNGSLVKGFKTTDEFGQPVVNDVNSYPNFRIYWDGDLQDEWFDSRHVDKYNDTTDAFERLYTFDSPSHPARSINGTKENPNLQTDLFGDWREEVIFYDYDVTSTIQKTVCSKSINDGAEFTIDWDNRQYYMVIFNTVVPTDYRLPWLRDDHVYDMSIVWQNTGYNQPPHLGYDPVSVYGKKEDYDSVKNVETSSQTDAQYYTLQGLRVTTPVGRGLYITNNKKVIVK